MESAPFTEDQRKHVQSFSDIKKPTKCIRRLLQKMKLWCQIEELKNKKIYEAAANIGIKQFEQTERGGLLSDGQCHCLAPSKAAARHKANLWLVNGHPHLLYFQYLAATCRGGKFNQIVRQRRTLLI